MNPELSEEIQLIAEHQAGHCRALGKPERVLILWLLMEKELTLNEIVLTIKASHPSTTRHLNILSFNKLVESRQDHHGVFYHIANNKQTQDCLVLKNKPQTFLAKINQTK